MRWLTLLAVFAAWATAAGEIVVTTWNLQWFPSGTSRKATDETEAERIRLAAKTLKAVSPDILLVQEVRDFATCYRLASQIGGLKVVVCSSFTDFGGSLGWQQVAILSKTDAISAWSENWKSTGTVDPPRGFAFAHLRLGTNDVAVYSVHLKSNLVRSSDEKESQLNILKRELAAEQIVRHLTATEKTLGEHFEVVVVGGDFNTCRDQFLSEATLSTMEEAGFKSGFEGLPLKERVTHPANGKYPDATFDYLFVQGAEAVTRPHMLQSTLSDHRPVTRTLFLPQSGTNLPGWSTPKETPR